MISQELVWNLKKKKQITHKINTHWEKSQKSERKSTKNHKYGAWLFRKSPPPKNDKFGEKIFLKYYSVILLSRLDMNNGASYFEVKIRFLKITENKVSQEKENDHEKNILFQLPTKHLAGELV